MSNKVEITRAFFKQALREGDFRLAASDMNYENNRNPKDTNLSSAEITPIMVSRVSREKSRQLKRRFATAIIALFLTFLAVASATYAWYIYNTSRHTTNVRMAAGAGVNLQISNAYNGTYGSAAVLDSFAGQLVPVSTNRITGGFQKVLGFTEGNSQSGLVASIFGSGSRQIIIIPVYSFGQMVLLPIFMFLISAMKTVMKRILFLQQSVLAWWFISQDRISP